MDLGLKDRVAIIGGSSRGMARVGSQQHVLAIPADLSIARDIRRVVRDTFNRFGQIGILVTHMGYGPPGRPSEFNDETIMTALEENFLSAVRFAREVVPFMKQQRWGRIIHLLPSLGSISANGTALSTTSQMALVGYSKMLANELAPFNITVNNLVSGPVETDYLTASLESEAQKSGKAFEELMKDAVSVIPMGRLGKPEEVGDLVAFLASDRASFLTGASVVLDGGMLQTIN